MMARLGRSMWLYASRIQVFQRGAARGVEKPGAVNILAQRSKIYPAGGLFVFIGIGLTA